MIESIEIKAQKTLIVNKKNFFLLRLFKVQHEELIK